MIVETVIVSLAAFFAGFVDAIVGGGGLIQTPVVLMTFPQMPVATLLGTTKIPSFCGTAISFYHYSKRVLIHWKLVGLIAVLAFAASLLGSAMVSHVSNHMFKPIILVALCVVAVYTYTKKDFGQIESKKIDFSIALFKGAISGLLIGFYDGFIGPGTGSFLILIFISLLGNDFLHASAHAKLVNLATNLASILYFSLSGNIIFALAIPMAVSNMLGGYLGSKFALLKGNKFIRLFFLAIVIGTIIRFMFDVF